MISAWRAVATSLADLLLPSVCPGCHTAAGPGLCPPCLALIPRPTDPCRWCAAPGQSREGRCSACRNRGLPHLRRILIGCVYRGLVEDLVGDAKAGARPAAVRVLGDLLPALSESDALAVVPVPAARGRRPGPHLATALARALARREQLPLRTPLRATRIAAEQHRLGRAERRRNVAGLFVSHPVPERVLLVDDLLTSGATAVAAAAALRAAGAQRIDLVCLARTPRRGEPGLS